MSGPTFRFEPEKPAPGAAAEGLRPPPRLVVTPSSGGLLRTLSSPRGMYALAFLASTALLYIRFNPHFGNFDYGPLAGRSPLNIFRDAAGAWHLNWGLAQRAVVFLVVLCVGYLVLACWRAGRRRGAIAASLALLVFVTRPPPPSDLGVVMLYIAAAGVCGALLVPPERATVWTRRVLWLSLCTLLAVIWMPFKTTTTATHSVYQSAGLEMITAYLNPPTHMHEKALDTLSQYEHVLAAKFPETLAFLISLIGLLAAVGIRGAWTRWVAFLSVVTLVVGSSVLWARNASLTMQHGMFTPTQNGLYALGSLWFDQFTIHTLPVVALVQDLTSRTQESARN